MSMVHFCINLSFVNLKKMIKSKTTILMPWLLFFSLAISFKSDHFQSKQLMGQLMGALSGDKILSR